MNIRLWIAGATLTLVGCGSSSSTATRAPYSASGPSRQATTSRPMPVAEAPRRAPAGPVPAARSAAAMPSGGTFAWAMTLREAQENARSTGRLVFLEAGRPGCGNCQALKNKVVPDPSVYGELGAVAIGFYDDIDSHPKSEAIQVLYANLPRAVMLPLAGWVTPDMRWVYGFSGATNPAKFRQDIATARSAYMRMTETERPAARREMGFAPARSTSLPDAELADVVAELGEDAAKDLAAPAIAAAAPVAPTTTAAPSSTETPLGSESPVAPPAVAEAPPLPVAPSAPAAVPIPLPPTATPETPAVAAAPVLPSAPATGSAPATLPAGSDATRAWARESLEQAKSRLSIHDFAGARAILADVRAKAAGLPEEREADKGEVAIYNLRKIERAGEPIEAAKAREQAHRDLKNTVWAALFA